MGIIEMLKKEVQNIKESGIKNEIIKGKMILEGMKKEIDDKRENFLIEILKVPFVYDLKKEFKDFQEFSSYIQEGCKTLSEACFSRSGGSHSKSKSKPYLDSLVKKSNNLIDSLTFIDINNLKLVGLKTVHESFKSLSAKCLNTYKAKFPVTFGAVLDYKQTKECFKIISQNLQKLEKRFSELILEEECKILIEKSNEIINKRDFNDIKLNIYLPQATLGKYQEIKFSTRFSMCNNNKEKAIHLNEKINELSKAIKNQKQSNCKIQNFLNNELKTFISSIKEQAIVKCVICQDDADLSDTENVITTTCGHSFHKECLELWYSQHKTCPTCRKHINIQF